jgi:hypothetical protein
MTISHNVTLSIDSKNHLSVVFTISSGLRYEFCKPFSHRTTISSLGFERKNMIVLPIGVEPITLPIEAVCSIH